VFDAAVRVTPAAPATGPEARSAPTLSSRCLESRIFRAGERRGFREVRQPQ